MDSKSQNYVGYTCHNHKCNKCFYSSTKWDKLHLLQDIKTAKIQKTEVQIKELFAKIKCLYYKEQFLKAYGKIMLNHNTHLINQLDKEDPTGIPFPSPPPEQ